jgi:hypothetical protein
LTIDKQQALGQSVVSLGHCVVHIVHNDGDGDAMGRGKLLRLPASFFQGGMRTMILPSVVDKHKSAAVPVALIKRLQLANLAREANSVVVAENQNERAVPEKVRQGHPFAIGNLGDP